MLTIFTLRLVIILAGLLVITPSRSDAAPIVFSVGGSDAASIQPTVDAFRAALGNPNNANNPGPLSGGRREINWDGGGAINGTAAVTPFTVFQNIRGATFTTPGTGLTQAPISGGTLSLADINATYAAIFTTFSPLRLFTPLGSNITDGFFFLPGSNGAIPATVSGFGAVFTDVDLTNSTQIEYFGASGSLLFSSFVEPGTVADGSLSFLGVLFDAGERIGALRITTGNSSLGPNDGGGVDVVVMDDFLYSEPQAVPEPSTWLLLASGLLGLAAWRRKKAA